MCTQERLEAQLSELEDLVEEDLSNGKHAQRSFKNHLKNNGACPIKFVEEIESCSVGKGVTNSKE